MLGGFDHSETHNKTVRSTMRREFLKAGLLPFGLGSSSLVSSVGKDSCEERLANSRLRFQRGLAEERACLFKALISRFGQGILDMVRENTIQQAESSLREARIPTRDLEAVLDVLWKPSAGLLKYHIKRRTPESLILHVTECLFATVMRSHAAAEIGEAFYCAYDHGFCAGLNPMIRFTRTQTLMEGADHCDHTYLLKAS